MSSMATRVRARRGAVGLACLSLLLTACGTRMSDEAIALREGGGAALAAGSSSEVGGAVAGDVSEGSVAAGDAAVGDTAADAAGSGAAPGAATTDTGAAPAAVDGADSSAGAGPATGGGSAAGGSAGATGGGAAAGSGGGAAAPGGAGSAVTASAIGPAGESTGCTKKLSPIKIGQVGTFSGFIAPVTAGSKPGLAAWASYVNSKGGVACHPVQITSKDDASDSSQAASAVQDLVQNKKVVALVANFVPLAINGFKSGVESNKVPAVGGDVLGGQWNDSPFLFPQMAGIRAALYGSYKQLVDQGKKKVGILYCVETDICPNAYKAATTGGDVKKAGAEIVYNAQVSLTQPDYQAQCQAAKNAGADFLALYVDGSSMTRVARSCASIGYFPPIATSAVAIGASQSADPNVIKTGVSLAPGTFAWTQSDNAAQKTYQDAMRKYAPNTASDGATAAAWTSGVLFAQAINKLGAKASGDITTAMVLEGLGKIKNETLFGLTPGITFSPGQQRAPSGKCYYLMSLQKSGKWSAPQGSKFQCMP